MSPGLMSTLWDCPTCKEWFDLWWMIDRDLVWVDSLIEPIEEYEDFFMNSPTGLDPDAIWQSLEQICLCCDEPFERCKEFNVFHNRIVNSPNYINEDDPGAYLRKRGIPWGAIYEEEFVSKCQTCSFYREASCIPLRNTIRFHNATGKLPHYTISICSLYDEDKDVIELDQLNESAHLIEEEERQRIHSMYSDIDSE